MTAHRCDWSRAWPTGHPLPPEDPTKLQGPEVGEFVLYAPKSSTSRMVDGVLVPDPDPEPIVVRVIRRSYVWSPGECSSNGGFRHYDWSVIEEGPDGYRSVVVNDSDLRPLPVDPWTHRPKKVSLAYAVQP